MFFHFILEEERNWGMHHNFANNFTQTAR